MKLTGNNLLRIAFAAAMFGLAGCGQNAAPPQPAAQATPAGHDHEPAPADAHDHGGWWCAEHGVPEAECSQCDAKVAAAFQKKGDWCKEHDRARSQCFICDPKAKEKYVAVYKAKYGHEPPALEDDAPEDDVDKEAQPKG